MKSILVVVPELDLGGVTTAAINFCNELIERGNKVTLLNMGGASNSVLNMNPKINNVYLDKFAKYWNLRLEYIKIAKGSEKIKMLFYGILKKVSNRRGKWLDIVFANYSIAEEYDVVVAYKQCAPCYYFALNCVRAKKKVAYIHGDINYMGDISSWDNLMGEFDYIACVSNAVMIGFQKRYISIADKFRVVYNMVDVCRVREQSKELCKIAINSLKFNIITIARNENSHKQIDWIPQVCVLLKKYEIKNIHWYIIGEGPDLEYNKELAKKLEVDDMIKFCGAYRNPYPILALCDLLVLPSKTESYGMVIDEAHILQKPVIATNYPALSEVLDDGTTGLIANQSVGNLADKIKILVKNENGILDKIKTNLCFYEKTNDLPYKQFMDIIQ